MRPSDLFAGVPNELGFYQTRTAKHLGVTLRQVGYRIKKFGLESIVEEHKRGVSV